MVLGLRYKITTKIGRYNDSLYGYHAKYHRVDPIYPHRTNVCILCTSWRRPLRGRQCERKWISHRSQRQATYARCCEVEISRVYPSLIVRAFPHRYRVTHHRCHRPPRSPRSSGRPQPRPPPHLRTMALVASSTTATIVSPHHQCHRPPIATLSTHLASGVCAGAQSDRTLASSKSGSGSGP